MKNNFKRTSNFRKALRLKSKVCYMNLESLSKYVPYKIINFTVKYDIPIVTLEESEMHLIVFLPGEYKKLKIDPKQNYWFEYYADTLINSTQKFLIYQRKKF